MLFFVANEKDKRQKLLEIIRDKSNHFDELGYSKDNRILVLSKEEHYILTEKNTTWLMGNILYGFHIEVYDA